MTDNSSARDTSPAIDVNVHVGTWPFRALAGESLERFGATLRRAGIGTAWAASFEGLFHRDIAGVNERLARACAGTRDPVLRPVGAINPLLPDWEEDLRRCVEVLKMHAIRLYPGFHGYAAGEPALADVLAKATGAGLVVQIVVSMEDERTQNPEFRVKPFDALPLRKVIANVDGLRLVLLNAFRGLSVDQAAELATDRTVWFDLAMLEGVDRVRSLVEKVGGDRVLFGTHAPLFYPEAAGLKLTESSLAASEVARIRTANAEPLGRPQGPAAP